ncbi:MAG: opacity protein-like surface antigen, partial [Oleispira sp.]
LSTNLVAFSITVFADLDRDGISDVTDLDIDGDGMSNAFEIANGLDPFDASDASGDLDGDGKTNLEEFTNNSDPSRDDYGPVIILESIVTIDAVALLTDLPANLASAEDENDGDVLVTHDLSTELLEPGVHTIIWLAVDAAGNSTSETQTLNVRPLANWQVDQETGEGNTVTVTLYLNGEAPIYPVVANYTVSGSATNPADHNAVSGSLIINSGQSASVDVVVTSDITSELDETVIFTLDSISNATFGVQKDHQITISEVNHAPRVSLSTPFTLLALTSGTVTVTATIDDADLSDSHTNTWMANNGLSGNANNTSYSFDPAVVGAGTYQISVTSEDDAVSSLSGTAVITLTVLDQVLSLSDSIDSDGDGVNDSAEGAGDSDGDNVPDFADSAAEENVLAIFPVGGEPNDGAWFMEAQPGISLHLNVYSSASGDFSPLLEEGDIIDANEINNSDTGHEYIGGIFDFVLSNIPVQGETVFVVLPQLNAIPANAIYRKEVNGRWSAFEEDANNILSSALGEQGICPPPGSMEYVPGLTEGHFCVQLGLEDGGANDADGEANGSIIDPGGVAVAVPTRVSTGGGAMAWPALLLMSLMVLGRIAGVSVLMLGLSSIAHASEWLKSAYTTVHVGHADSNVSTEEVQGEFNGAGISNTTINDVDDPRKGFGLGVGYSFIPNWGIELAYLDLRQVDVDLTSTQAINNLDDVMPESGDGFTLSVLHRYPLDEIANVRFRLGVFDWQADYDTPTGAGSQVGSIEQSGTDWYAGIGFDHKITDQLNITTEFQYFDFNRDNTTYFRLGLEWHLDYGK